MNFFGLNRSALNSAVYALVLATASIDCSAGVNAVAIRDAEALSPVSSAAYITADAQVTRYVSANIDCAGGLYPQVTHIHACTATLNTKAELVAYVLRSVQAQSTLACTADIIAVVASTMGSSATAAGATVTADATRIQAARSTAEGLCTVTLSVAPTAWRMAHASVAGSASVRAEYSIWQIANPYTLHPSYGEVSGTANITAVSLLSRKPVTVLNCVAMVSGVGTRKQPGRSVSDASATFIVAEPFVLAGGAAQPHCSATVIAQAVRVLITSAISMASSAVVTAAPVQKHAASASLPCSGGIAALGTITQFGQETLQGNSSVTATAVRVLVPTADLVTGATLVADATRLVNTATASASATAEFTADPLLNKIAVANPVSAADISATAVRVLMGIAQMQLGTAEATASVTYFAPGYADLRSGAEMTAAAVLYKVGVASMNAAASMTALSLRTVLPSASLASSADLGATAVRHVVAASNLACSAQAGADALRTVEPFVQVSANAEFTANALRSSPGYADFYGSAEILADTVTNAASVDPDDRIFYSPARTTDFVRPFIETEFRRAA